MATTMTTMTARRITELNVPFFNLSRQYALLADELEPALKECLASCAYVGGKYVAAFEGEMSEYLGVRHAVGVGNGTDALMLALRACNVRPGDEVITTPFSFFATAEAIAAVGGTPVFVDVREGDFNIDPALIEPAVTDRTKVILPVHIFGQPADLDAIMPIARKHGLKVVDDAAQGIGAEIGGRRVGGLADVTTWSFYPTKNLGACGDAGMATTNDDGLATALRALKEHGAARNGAIARELLDGVAEEGLREDLTDSLYNPFKYYNYIIGYNSRLDALQAAALSVKLRHLGEYGEKRERISEFYTDALEGVAGVTTPPRSTAAKRSCWHQYAIRVDDKKGMAAHLAARGVGAGEFYPVPLHLQKAFSRLGYGEGSLPVAEKLCRQTVCLPIFPELERAELEAVTDAVKAFF
jgi:dTDP-4-amino-4,6-dideoxygalactose transaminase